MSLTHLSAMDMIRQDGTSSLEGVAATRSVQETSSWASGLVGSTASKLAEFDFGIFFDVGEAKRKACQ